MIKSPVAESKNRVLQFTDTLGQKQRYHPMRARSRKHSKGTTSCKFAIRLDKNAVFQHEWRGSSHTYRDGPSLWFENGKLRSSSRVVTEHPLNEWILIDITAKLGKHAGEWSVSVMTPHQPT